jgi:hypothetical protein
MNKNVRFVLLSKKWARSKKRLPIIGGAYIEAPMIGAGVLLPKAKNEMGKL